jgi:hypothetical protein
MIEVQGHTFDIGDSVQITIDSGCLFMMEVGLGVFMEQGVYNGTIFSEHDFGRHTKIVLKIGSNSIAREFVFFSASNSERIIERRVVLTEKFKPLKELNKLI